MNFTKEDMLSAARMQPKTASSGSTDGYMKTYNVIRIGDIVFEGHRSSNYKYGRFVLNDFRDGIVSHVFDVFSPRVDLCSDFMRYYIHDERIMQKVLLYSTSQARMLNSLNVKELSRQGLRVPELKEQKVIGNLLKKTDCLIASNQLQQKSHESNSIRGP
nr:restriction endonuclease subunit S [Levilactobacillus spicheri]